MGRPADQARARNSSSPSGWQPRWREPGATLEDVVHAQVYLADRDDYSAFNEAWTRHFGDMGPTTSIIPCLNHGLAPYDGKIEYDVIAAKPGGAASKRHIDGSCSSAHSVISRRP